MRLDLRLPVRRPAENGIAFTALASVLALVLWAFAIAPGTARASGPTLTLSPNCIAADEVNPPITGTLTGGPPNTRVHFYVEPTTGTTYNGVFGAAIATTDASGSATMTIPAGQFGLPEGNWPAKIRSEPAWPSVVVETALQVGNCVTAGQIAFVRGSNIYVMNSDGTGERQLTTGPYSKTSPVWSPDGSKIAYIAYALESGWGIWTMNADGTGQSRVTGAGGGGVSWSPDGSKIAFVGETWPYQIFVVNRDGTGRTAVTSAAVSHFEPAWSPDGQTIVFQHDEVGYALYGQRVDANAAPVGAEYRLSGTLPWGYSEYGPAWSPDGSKLAFMSNLTGHQIAVMNPDGSGRRTITPQEGQSALYPAWSPDGTTIIYRNGWDGRLWVVNADGTGNRSLGTYGDQPSWGVHADGPADPTPPAIAPYIEGTLGENGWYVGDVSLSWVVTETESPASLLTAGCVNQTIGADQQSTAYTCSATSLGGAEGPVEVEIKRDAHAPSIDCATIPSGWRADNVTLNCTASDVGPSGLANPADAAFQLSTNVADGSETNDASVTARTVADVAGNEATTGPFTFSVDRKAPIVSLRADGDSCTLPGDGGWCRGTQSAGFSAADGGSGLASDGARSRDLTRPNAEEGSAVMIASGLIEDMVGNSAPMLSAGPYKIDSSAPNVSCASPAPVFKLGQTGASVSASVTDAISGPVSASVSDAADAGSVGGKTVTVTGYDEAGNSKQASCSYRVVYDWSGFFQPVDNRDVSGNYILNKAKAGSTIPVKFSLAGDEGLGVFALNSPSSGPIACSSASTTDTIEQYSTTTVSGLKYDPLANQYVYNWKTDGRWANSCRQLVVKLIDGSEHRANFQFVK